MLGLRGGIAGDFTIGKLDEDDFLMIGSGIAERFHTRFFNWVQRAQSVSFESITEAWAGFNIAGPNSRALLGRLTETDLSNDAFKFMRSQKISIAGLDAVAVRVSFSGDLGWEIYVPVEHQLELYDALLGAGRGLGARPVGGSAR